MLCSNMMLPFLMMCALNRRQHAAVQNRIKKCGLKTKEIMDGFKAKNLKVPGTTAANATATAAGKSKAKANRLTSAARTAQRWRKGAALVNNMLRVNKEYVNVDAMSPEERLEREFMRHIATYELKLALLQVGVGGVSLCRVCAVYVPCLCRAPTVSVPVR
jgi:hypothetical protein